MSKYPPFRRVPAGQLKRGDRVLIRENQTDRLWLDGFDEHPWQDRPVMPTGVHAVTGMETSLRSGFRRSTRYYTVYFDGFHASSTLPLAVTCSSVQRWNLVIEDDD